MRAALAIFGLVLGALIAYGLACSLRDWWERRHALRLLQEMAEKEARADRLARAADELERLWDLPAYERLGSWTVSE